jgi:hypothetical protein
VELYWRRDSPGDPLPINLQGPAIPDKVPSDHKIRDAAGDLPSGRAGGASKMCAEDIKRWLRGIMLEEDPEKGPDNMGEGNNWRLLVGLIQAIWTQGKIPQQSTWVIVVLLPKGGEDYCGIGLLEPLWKVVERIMDRQLNALPLHEARHKTNKSFWRIKRILQFRFNVTVVFLLYLTRQTYQLYLIPFV